MALTVKWTFETGEAIVSSPAVAGGTVYVGSSDNFLYAVDVESGKLRWKFDAHGNVGSSPAVSGDTVFVVSMDGKLYAVNAATGVEGTLALAQERARLSQTGPFVTAERGHSTAMGAGVFDNAGQIDGRRIHLNMLGGEEDFMRLHVHGHTAAMCAARATRHGRSDLGRCFRQGAVDLLHAPVECCEHRGRFVHFRQPLLHASRRLREELATLFVEGRGKHERFKLQARGPVATQMLVGSRL